MTRLDNLLAARRSAAGRQCRRRDRARRGVVVRPIETDDQMTITALLNSGRISDAEALRREFVERALAQVLAEWAARWLERGK